MANSSAVSVHHNITVAQDDVTNRCFCDHSPKIDSHTVQIIKERRPASSIIEHYTRLHATNSTEKEGEHMTKPSETDAVTVETKSENKEETRIAKSAVKEVVTKVTSPPSNDQWTLLLCSALLLEHGELVEDLMTQFDICNTDTTGFYNQVREYNT